MDLRMKQIQINPALFPGVKMTPKIKGMVLMVLEMAQLLLSSHFTKKNLSSGAHSCVAKEESSFFGELVLYVFWLGFFSCAKWICSACSNKPTQ